MSKLLVVFKALINKTPVVEMEVNSTLSSNQEEFMKYCKEQIRIIEARITENAKNGKTYTVYCNFDLSVDVKNVICEYFEKAGYVTDYEMHAIGITMPVSSSDDVEHH